jgi:hypothetical protein
MFSQEIMDRLRSMVGNRLWEAMTMDGKTTKQEWLLRTVRLRKSAGREYIVLYYVAKINGVTWVKRSKKHGDFGWATIIPRHSRKRVYIHRASELKPGKIPCPLYLFDNIKDALEHNVELLENERDDLKEEIDAALSVDKQEWRDMLISCEEDLKSARRALIREENKGEKE